MHIEFLEIANFRKLLSTRIDLSNTTTLFVGANNSGKTSAMLALCRFLSPRRCPFEMHDFTLCHWPTIIALGEAWIAAWNAKEIVDLVVDPWVNALPTLDLWLSLHPGLLEGETTEEFNLSPARVSAAIDILRHIKSKNERALVFIENRDVQTWIAEVVRIEFDLERVMIINGDTTVDARKDITDRFQRHLVDDRGFDVLILGPRAAGTGLTLTAANHVIHLSRWWNPAVEEQCNDRTHRIGQTKPVTIHIPLAVHPGLGRDSFDCLLQSLMKRKRSLADRILWPGDVTEGETKMLYDAVLAAETTSDLKSMHVDEILEGRSDLHFEKLAENSIRVKPTRGGASIIVSSDAAVPMPMSGENGDAAVITLNEQSRVPAGVIVPQSKLKTATLWPEYILPE